MLKTALGKQRLIGLIFLAVLMVAFLTLNRAPKLDTIREDIDQTAAVAAAELGTVLVTQAGAGEIAVGRAGAGLNLLCAQGYCARSAPESTLASRWWDFSSEYLQLVAMGMVFAFLVAGLTEVFLFPNQSQARFTGRGWRGTLKRLATGTPMTLCSACIVPIANAIGRRGARPESIVAVVQGSSTLNLPALIMLIVVFTPMMAGARIGVSLVAAVALGPLVAYTIRSRISSEPEPLLNAVLPARISSWGEVIREGLRDWPRASFGYFVRLGPIMVGAALLSGLVIQWVDEGTVQRFLGNDVQGVALAAAIGILINVPLLFEIPLVALLLVLGMGEGPAAALLFTAAAGGPITFWGLTRVLPKRAVLTFGAGTWALGAAAGLAVLAIALVGSDLDFGVRDTVVSAAPATSTPADTP